MNASISLLFIIYLDVRMFGHLLSAPMLIYTYLKRLNLISPPACALLHAHSSLPPRAIQFLRGLLFIHVAFVADLDPV